jgi:broad specificity phosphatase PhoE
MVLIFVRHGESEANVQNLFYGSSDYPLTDLGKAQAEKAGKILRAMDFTPDRIYVSSLVRTHETLTAMGYSLEDAERDSRLDERHLGTMEGFRYEELLERHPGVFEEWRSNFLEYRPGGGESLLDVHSRVRDFLDEMKTLYHNGEKLLVVCHGGTMKTVLARVFGAEIDTFAKIEIYNCSLMRIRENAHGFFLDALINIEDYPEDLASLEGTS